MAAVASARIRKTILESLAERGLGPVGEDDALFSTGLLDSLAATEVLVALETGYGIDLGDEDFDIRQIDTLAGIEKLVASRHPIARLPRAMVGDTQQA